MVGKPAARLDRRRYWRVVRFFAGAFLRIVWWDLILRRIPAVRGIAERTALDRWRGIARSFRRLAIRMGGVLIKMGQFMSVRVDVLPEAITAELAGLQDEVPAETEEAIIALLAGEFGRPAGDVFAWFSPQPEAAASLAQVHRARLRDGTAVVVKVQRPAIESLVETDLAALRVAINWLKLYRTVARRVDLDRLFAEFAGTTRRELDFIAEGHNAERFAQDFHTDPGICIAKVYWDYTTPRALTLENVASIKITDFAAIEAAGISRSEAARRLFDTYLRQIFVTNFVHADPHPGNLFLNPVQAESWKGEEVDASTPSSFQLIFVDFGMVATVPPQLRGALKEYLIGFGTRDAHRLVQAYVDGGLLLPGADLKRLEALHDDMFRRFAGVRLGQLRDVAMAQAEQLFHEYRDILQEMPFQLPADILFVGRAMGILSGLATSLDPDFDPWAAIMPFAEQLAADEAGGVLRGALNEVTELGGALLALPGRMDRVLRQAERGDLAVQTGLAPDAARALRRIERAADRLAWAVVFAGLLIGGVLLRSSEGPGTLSTGLLVAAGLALVWGATRR